MAQHRPRFTDSERKVMDELFDPEILSAKVPEIAEIVEGAARLREVQDEINMVGKYQRANGFLKDRSMQRIAKINSALMLTIEDFHKAGCTCGREVMSGNGHKAWFYLWLDGPGQPYDLRGKVVI